VVADLLTVTAHQLGGPGAYDLVVARPPCEGFSVGSIGRHWDLDRRGGTATPKSDGARLGVAIAEATCALIADLAPPLGWVIENPTGMMRHLLGFAGPTTVAGLTSRRWLHPDTTSERAPSVTYCTLGMHYRKPTDLWAGGPVADYLGVLPAPCEPVRGSRVRHQGRWCRVNGRTGQPCHEIAERGATTGVQGLATYAERSLVPAQLSALVGEAASDAARELHVTPQGPPRLDPAIRGYAQASLL
jgi:hypothetical protein